MARTTKQGNSKEAEAPPDTAVRSREGTVKLEEVLSKSHTASQYLQTLPLQGTDKGIHVMTDRVQDRGYLHIVFRSFRKRDVWKGHTREGTYQESRT